MAKLNEIQIGGVVYDFQDKDAAKIHVGTSAPSDTTALWIDTDDSTETGGSGGNTSTGLTQVYHVGTSAPSDTNLLWIDTNTSTGGLKYYNGSTWTHVPVAYT